MSQNHAPSWFHRTLHHRVPGRGGLDRDSVRSFSSICQFTGLLEKEVCPPMGRKHTSCTEERGRTVFTKHLLQTRGYTRGLACPLHPTRPSTVPQTPNQRASLAFKCRLVPLQSQRSSLWKASPPRVLSPRCSPILCSYSRFHGSVPWKVFHNKWLGGR